MPDFAKIICVDGEQVLFYLEPDPDDEEKSRLNQICQPDGMIANIACGGITEIEGILDKIDETAARNVLRIVREFSDA